MTFSAVSHLELATAADSLRTALFLRHLRTDAEFPLRFRPTKLPPLEAELEHRSFKNKLFAQSSHMPPSFPTLSPKATLDIHTDTMTPPVDKLWLLFQTLHYPRDDNFESDFLKVLGPAPTHHDHPNSPSRQPPTSAPVISPARAHTSSSTLPARRLSQTSSPVW